MTENLQNIEPKSDDPFARDSESISEIQEQEKNLSETFPQTIPGVPGNPTRPGSSEMQGLLSLEEPVPNVERPAKPGVPEIKPLHQPESQPIHQPEIAPSRPAPEVQIPIEPSRHQNPTDRTKENAEHGLRDGVHTGSSLQGDSSEGELNRVFPSIQNHDNLEGIADTAEENWHEENLDLDIDNDSNRQD